MDGFDGCNVDLQSGSEVTFPSWGDSDFQSWGAELSAAQGHDTCRQHASSNGTLGCVQHKGG